MKHGDEEVGLKLHGSFDDGEIGVSIHADGFGFVLLFISIGVLIGWLVWG